VCGFKGLDIPDMVTQPAPKVP